MKYVLAIVLIVLLMIGIYTHAHMHRYQVFIDPLDVEVIIKYDSWTDSTFVYYYEGKVWIELGKRQRKLKE